MLEYSYPEGGKIGSDSSKNFFYVEVAYDEHNYKIYDTPFIPVKAIGGTEQTYTSYGVVYKTHTFTTVGSSTFQVQDIGTAPSIRYLMVGGGGAGAARHGGGGGAGGFIEGVLNVSAQNYTIDIGAGGLGRFQDIAGNDGSPTTFAGLTALGGGGGGSWGNRNGRAGGSGGGGSEVSGNGGVGGAALQPGSASGGFGFAGAISQLNGTGHGSGGGGAGGAGTRGFDSTSGPGGAGRISTILGRTFYFAGGGGAGSWEAGEPRRGGSGGLGGAGGGGQARSGNVGRGGGVSLNSGLNGTVGIPNSTGGNGGANTGGGGGGGGAYPPNTGYESTRGGNGGSGIVIIRYPITRPLPVTYTNATGGALTQVTESGITYNVHTFSTPGLSTFQVTSLSNFNPEIEIFAYGAGGGGGQVGGWTFGSFGGAGGFATARHALTTPKTYAVMVGGGGANAEGTNNGLSSNVFTSGGGAPSKPNTSDDRYGAQGGGLSGLFDNNTYNVANAILIAGGGGGGGSSRAGTGNHGGAGGGLVGEDGSALYDGLAARRGRGGGQSGPTPLPTDGNATIPGQLTGGVTSSYGGGGGGGWWGGSAGTYQEANTMGGGGGGSSYADSTKTTNADFQTGTGLYPPQAGFRSSASIASGGPVASVGGNGLVIIRYPIGIVS
jgi:hypothetical protein